MTSAMHAEISIRLMVLSLYPWNETWCSVESASYRATHTNPDFPHLFGEHGPSTNVWTACGSAFITADDNATQRFGVGWNLTMGLYWVRLWNFPTLDAPSQRYITKKLNILIGMNGPKGRCNASNYLAVLDTPEARFQEDAYPVRPFPELSLAAWHFKDGGISAILMPQTLMRRMMKRKQSQKRRSRPHPSNRTPSMTSLRIGRALRACALWQGSLLLSYALSSKK
jgi:hypothetical protein